MLRLCCNIVIALPPPPLPPPSYDFGRACHEYTWHEYAPPARRSLVEMPCAFDFMLVSALCPLVLSLLVVAVGWFYTVHAHPTTLTTTTVVPIPGVSVRSSVFLLCFHWQCAVSQQKCCAHLVHIHTYPSKPPFCCVLSISRPTLVPRDRVALMSHHLRSCSHR